MANFCTDCIHWERLHPKPSTEKGICSDGSVAMHVAIEEGSGMIESGTLWTSPYFGCVYWRDNDGSLLNFDDIIDEDGKPTK